MRSVQPSPDPAPSRPLKRWGRRLLAGPLVLAVLLFGTLWIALRLSLAKLDGEARVPNLSAPLTVSRDAQGVPSIVATNRLDLARATGFLHAQDRFFQMDLLRRASAGELSELLGPGLIAQDRSVRQFRMRHVAEQAMTLLGEPERALLTAYADGVNHGLAALPVRPPEYLLLRQRPRPWKPKDSVLILHTMGLQLSDPGASGEPNFAIARESLPPAAFEFYVRGDTANPAALDGSIPPRPRLPTPEEFNARSGPTNRPAAVHRKDPFTPGSNAWAVEGRRTGTGAAMVANDMHLGLGLPNIWYRMQWYWHEADGIVRRLIGVTLPGTPAMIVGSNGRVAWGFTAAQLDVSDQVLIETDAAHPDACRVGSEWRRYEIAREEIRVSGEPGVLLEIPCSPWGPVTTNAAGQRIALRWAMQSPDAANFGLLAFERAESVAEVLDLAPACGLPWLNILAGDKDGNIGWTLGGRFPKRVGFDGLAPVSWADGSCGWQGWIEPPDMPRVLNPPAGAVWSANDRALGTEAYQRIRGGDNLDQGARSRQIRDQLLTLTNARPADLLAIQLDDRALFLDPWQKLVLETLDRAPNEARFQEVRPLVANWGGRASVESQGYAIVRDFRWWVIDRLLAPAAERCRAAGSGFTRLPGSAEGVAWDLLEQRPLHLLSPQFASYDELLVAAARETIKRLPLGPALANRTWGNRNRVKLQHPFGQAIPFLSRWLDLPERPLPGDGDMPRVQGRDFGASERLVVSPGHEDEGIFHMPGGQSGHFLSPFYAAGHRDWEEGRPSPLVPGPTRHVLTLKP